MESQEKENLKIRLVQLLEEDRVDTAIWELGEFIKSGKAYELNAFYLNQLIEELIDMRFAKKEGRNDVYEMHKKVAIGLVSKL